MPFTRVLTKSLKYAMDMATCGAKVDYGGVKWSVRNLGYGAILDAILAI
jgi:hypothetical protein